MLDELKAEVLRVSRLAEETGLCHHGGGNFSQIDRERGLVVITPHAVSRYSFSSEDMLVVDLEGNVVENLKGFTPSTETPMHLHIYKERPDALAVCHTHAHNAAAFACLGVPVKPVIFEAMMYGGYCRVVPFEEPGTTALGRSAVEGLKGSYATILGKHGLISIGESIYDAYLKTIYVEDVCDVNIRAASVVGYEKLDCFSDEQITYFRDVLGLKA
ncbi:MAG: class II aldolase/adducin family protein [Bacillota bacterium]